MRVGVRIRAPKTVRGIAIMPKRRIAAHGRHAEAPRVYGIIAAHGLTTDKGAQAREVAVPSRGCLARYVSM